MRQLALVVAIGFVSACDSPGWENGSDQTSDNAVSAPVVDEPLERQPDAQTELICYRGQQRLAERRGDDLLIEGDLLVSDFERWCDPGQTPAASNPDKGRRAPSSPGTVATAGDYGTAWPDGIVPFGIDQNFSAQEQSAIQSAMAAWSTAAPGVTFRPAVSTDASAVYFFKYSEALCQSGYGRIPGLRVVRLGAGCTDSFRVHHEIGHALGLQHEHTRSDRNSYVTVTTTDDNYKIDTGANLFAYDFDSVMHYPLDAVMTLAPGVTLPPGVTPGQRNHLSATDVSSMRAMYPVMKTRFLLFARTGTRPLCVLEGREQDIATEITHSSSTTAFAGVGTDVSTDSLLPGDYAVTCSARSLFWKRDYAYPNTTVTAPITSANQADAIQYVHAGNVRVLTPGLIPLMMTP